MRILPHLGSGIAAALMACVVCPVRAQFAVPKVDFCPSGYTGSGNDCVRRN